MPSKKKAPPAPAVLLSEEDSTVTPTSSKQISAVTTCPANPVHDGVSNSGAADTLPHTKTVPLVRARGGGVRKKNKELLKEEKDEKDENIEGVAGHDGEAEDGKPPVMNTVVTRATSPPPTDTADMTSAIEMTEEHRLPQKTPRAKTARTTKSATSAGQKKATSSDTKEGTEPPVPVVRRGGKKGRIPAPPPLPNADDATATGSGSVRTTKYVFNAFESDNNRRLSKAYTSDDENVILRLNINNNCVDTAREDEDDSASCAPAALDETSYGLDDTLRPPIGCPKAFDEQAKSSFSSRPSVFEETEYIRCAKAAAALNNHHPTTTSSASPAFGPVMTTSGFQPGLARDTTDFVHSHPHQHLRQMRLLMEFEEKNKANEWPANTNVHCYWCCHRFHNHPYGIPLKYVNGRFSVQGCFCSLECATAYNFGNGGSLDEMWERYSMINMLAHRFREQRHRDHVESDHNKQEYRGGNLAMVRQAPHRLTLSMFGGHLSIEEFRAYCPSHRMTVVNFPPMMTLTQQVEEINDTDVQSTHKYVPIPSERIDRYQREIKLKRTKPLVNKNNTLINAMNIRYHS
jgi:hypothetical protein